MIPCNRWLSGATIVLACVVATGCESSEKDGKVRDKDLERIARRERRQRDRDTSSRPDPIITRDRDRDADRGRDRDRIGAGDRRPGLGEVPADAQAVDTAEGARLEYEPTRDGVVYAYDVDDDRVIYVGRVRDRERFRLDPDGNRAMINSRTVFRSELNPRHRYRLYFEAAR